ncbi:MAG: ABC transporter ATP-binding protein [Gemmatimonadetes bacterium]|nr:ABC transporter ATP-binding protein [Gemmatimonadota bacterium]
MAPQEIAVYPDLTCTQNVAFFGAVYGLSRGESLARAQACLDAVGLRDRADSLVSELSGGMRRRLQLATALVHEPPFLILDEPTVGLDLEIRQQVWDLINGLRREGRSILLTTHHLEEAERLGTRIGIIDSGRIAVEGSMDALRRHVDAELLAVVESEDPDAVCRRAEELGITFRRRADTTVLWLTEDMPIRSVVDTLGDVQLTSVRLKPVGLEEVFAEVLGRAEGVVAPRD